MGVAEHIGVLVGEHEHHVVNEDCLLQLVRLGLVRDDLPSAMLSVFHPDFSLEGDTCILYLRAQAVSHIIVPIA